MVGADGIAVPEVEVDVGRLGVLAPAQISVGYAERPEPLARPLLAPISGTVASNAPALTTSRRESVVASSSSRHGCTSIIPSRGGWGGRCPFRLAAVGRLPHQGPDEGLWRGS